MQKFAIFNAETAKFGLILTHLMLIIFFENWGQENFFGEMPPMPSCDAASVINTEIIYIFFPFLVSDLLYSSSDLSKF